MGKRIIRNLDVSSLYPNVMINFDAISRNIPTKDHYVNLVEKRLKAKKAGDKKTANALKLIVNTSYGASLSTFNDLYDAKMGRRVCLIGQLLLTEFTMNIYKSCKSIKILNVNTDGVMYSIDDEEQPIVDEIRKEWEERTGLELEEDKIKRVMIKDCNNYILEKLDGSLKVKGGYVSDYKPSFKHNSLSIVAEAIVKYFMESTPVEDTINACNDPFRFQLIAKTGSTYDRTVHYVDGEEIPVQKVNRLYAVTDDRYGVVKKVKKQYLELDEDGERRYYINQKGKRTYKKKWETDEGGDFFIKKDTTQNCPEHAIIDNECNITINTIDTINRKWYIELARKRINDFLGIKEEKKKMATTKKTETLKINPINVDENGNVTINENLAKIVLYKKIQAVGEWLASQPWVADGYNSQQDYEYVKSHKYRDMLGKACRQVGLLFKITIANRTFQKLDATKNMNLTTIYGVVCFIDPDTGAHEDYPTIADGSDNLDKGIYKAETMLIKNFVLNTFLLPQQQDEIDPEDGKDEKKVANEEKKAEQEKKKKTDVIKVTPEPDKKAPATPKQREEAAQEVVGDNLATNKYVETMIEAIEKIQAAGGTDRKGKPYGASTKTNLEKVLKGELQLTKTEAIAKMEKIEDKMDEMGIE